MTLARNTPNWAEKPGDGATVSHPIPFRYPYAAAIKARVRDATGAMRDIAFTVSEPGPHGGTVTLQAPVPLGETLFFWSDSAAEQPYDYSAYPNFPYERHEENLDRLAMTVRDTQYGLRRCLQFPTPQDSIHVPAPRAGYAIGWNLEGQLDNLPVGSASSVPVLLQDLGLGGLAFQSLASGVPVAPVAPLTKTNVQDALQEVATLAAAASQSAETAGASATASQTAADTATATAGQALTTANAATAAIGSISNGRLIVHGGSRADVFDCTGVIDLFSVVTTRDCYLEISARGRASWDNYGGARDQIRFDLLLNGAVLWSTGAIYRDEGQSFEQSWSSPFAFPVVAPAAASVVLRVSRVRGSAQAIRHRASHLFVSEHPR